MSNACRQAALRRRLLTQAAHRREPLAAVAGWSTWPGEGDGADELIVLRRNTDKGLPCGSGSFIEGLESMVGQPLSYRPIGRPRHKKSER